MVAARIVKYTSPNIESVVDKAETTCGWNCPHPEAVRVSWGIYRVCFDDNVISLSCRIVVSNEISYYSSAGHTDSNEHRIGDVRIDGHEIGFNDCEVVIVDGEDECCIDTGVDKTHQIFLALQLSVRTCCGSGNKGR